MRMLKGLIRPKVRDYLDAATELWIGWTFPPVARAIEDAQWHPDDRSAYCGRCGDSVGVGESNESGCATCRQGEMAGGIGDGVVRLGPYVQSLRQWVLQIKYDRWAEMGDHLGHLLAQRLRASHGIDVDKTVVVPMPMPWARRFYRGIDHAGVIAAGVARELRAPLIPILRRANRPPQVTLVPSERRRSGSRGMAIRRRLGAWPIGGAHVVLVDDVCTTGSSLRAAARLLGTLKPARVICGVLAVSDSKARRDRAHRVAAPVQQIRELVDQAG